MLLMMKRLALMLAMACAAPPREVRQEPPPPPAVKEAPRPATIADENVLVEYRPQAEGKTLLEVVSPQGARVDVHDGQALAGRDVAPMTVRAEGDHWYTISARLPSGEARETKVQARAGQIASVRFAQSSPSGPQPMSRDEFKRFVHAVDLEAGDAAKLALIKSAAAHDWFTAAMAGVLIDHVVHRENKLTAVPLLKDRILDKENAFWLYQHFTYREDKAKVREMLEH
jgi:hypothetical protein